LAKNPQDRGVIRDEKNREKHSVTDAPRATSPVEVKKNEGRETSLFPQNRLLSFLAESIFIPLLGPTFFLWYMVDFLIPERFRAMRMAIGIPWKGLLL